MTTATLIDGTTTDTSSEAWRHECEARAILALPFEQRKAHMEVVAKRRGQAEAERISHTMGQIRKKETN